jgi:hypothetical protein
MRRFARILISSVLLCGLLCPPVSNAQDSAQQPREADRYADKIRAFESNPDGVMRAKTFIDFGGRWLKRPEMTATGLDFVSAAVELYPRDAALNEMLGDFLQRAGRKDKAAARYR